MRNRSGSRTKFKFLTLLMILVIAYSSETRAQEDPNVVKLGFVNDLDIDLDLKLRYENDTDSATFDEGHRAIVNRGRLGLKLGADYTPFERFTFGAATRLAPQRSPQVSMINLFDSDGEPGSRTAVLDKAFVKFDSKPVMSWIGRNELPFWQENDYFLDKDLRPDGLALALRYHAVLKQKYELRAGYFVMPEADYPSPYEENSISNRTTLIGVQSYYNRDFDFFDMTGAVGFFRFVDPNGVRNTSVEDLEYGILAVNLQEKFKLTDVTPLIVQVDYYHNFMEPESFDRYGIVAGFKVGNIYRPSGWMFGFDYFSIRKHGIVPYYGSDEWSNWGGNNAVRSSNVHGQALHGGYGFDSNFNTQLHYYIANGVSAGTEGKVNREANHRVQLDLNFVL